MQRTEKPNHQRHGSAGHQDRTARAAWPLHGDIRDLWGAHRNSICQTAHSLTSPSERRSHSFKYGVHLLHVRTVIDNPAFDFYPGMRVERDLLDSDHQLCGYSMAPKQTCRGRGPLQAKHPFSIPDASKIDRSTQFLQTGTTRGGLVNAAVAHYGMERREILAPDVKPKANQLQICGQDGNDHRPGSFPGPSQTLLFLSKTPGVHSVGIG